MIQRGSEKWRGGPGSSSERSVTGKAGRFHLKANCLVEEDACGVTNRFFTKCFLYNDWTLWLEGGVANRVQSTR